MANKYLGVLADLDLIEREMPVTEDKPAGYLTGKRSGADVRT